jgi:hypothetical protein
MQDFGEETERKTILGSLSVEGDIKMYFFWRCDKEETNGLM